MAVDALGNPVRLFLAQEQAVVCMDEQPVQLIAETRQPLPTEPGGAAITNIGAMERR